MDDPKVALCIRLKPPIVESFQVDILSKWGASSRNLPREVKLV